jgi:sugar phosphate isomerase/epimerase
VKLAVSNIAWPSEETDRFLSLLAEEGCGGVEIAASLLWPEPVATRVEERRRVRDRIASRGLAVTGLQALLYTRPELALFADEPTRRRTRDYLVGLMDVCVDLGGGVLVFGSPRNRRTGGRPPSEVQAIAVDFLGGVAAEAAARGVVFCIEPLGASETDFINSTREAKRWLDALGWPRGLGLHVDVKALMEAGETDGDGVVDSFSRATHVHVNDPELQAPGSTGVDHAPVARALAASRYDRFVSIEMRRAASDPEAAVRRAIAFVKGAYFHRD